MTLTQTKAIDRIEVVSHGDWSSIQVREARTVFEDGVVISKGFHRRSLTPDADLTNEEADVENVALAVFTEEVKNAYASAMEQAL